MILPCVEFGKIVAPDYQEQLRLGIFPAQEFQSINRIGNPLSPDFDIGNSKSVIPAHGKYCHMQSVCGLGRRAFSLVWRNICRNKHDALQSQLSSRPFRDNQMADMRRVERSAQDANALGFR